MPTRNGLVLMRAAFWFHLHRGFREPVLEKEMGQPQDWDERSKGLRNDCLDAAAGCRYLDGLDRRNRGV
jgi:hypothetical protein